MKKAILVFGSVLAVLLFNSCEAEPLNEDNQEQSLKIDKDKITGIDKSKIEKPGSQHEN